MAFYNAPSRADLELSNGPIDQPTAQVFLAYADEDRDLSLASSNLSAVEAIRQLLVEAGLSLWDRDSNLGPQEDPEMAISRATEASENYVILLSSHTLQNALCLQGLLFALSMNKRIVPVLLNTVEVEHLPDPLRAITWLDLRQVSLPLAGSQGGDQLLRTLSEDAAYHHTHTQLLVQALRWERQQRHPSGLLPRAAIYRYRRWLEAAQARQRYRPIHLQELFIQESLRQTGGEPAGVKHRPAAEDGLTQITNWLKQWIDF